VNKREILMSESSQDLSNKASNVSMINGEASGESKSDMTNAYPGRILRAARDELNFSIEQVAQELHLRPSVVVAMEQEEYDDFSSDVFLKGYFRSYCRLVNLHEERMVELLDAQLKHIQKDIDDAAMEVKKGHQLKKRKKALFGLLIVLALAGASAALLSYFYQEKLPFSTVKPDVIEETASINIAKIDKTHIQTNPKMTPVESDSKPESQLVPEKKTVDAPKIEKIKIASNVSKVDPVAIKNREQIGDRVSIKTEIETGKTEIEAGPEKVQSVDVIASEPADFKATFAGDCWFKFVDANQKTIFAALKRAGDSVSYSGITPFKIVLGDASKVNLSFEGKAINLRPYTAKNGRAQLTLRKD